MTVAIMVANILSPDLVCGVPERKWTESPVRSTEDARRAIQRIRDDSEIAAFHICHQAASAIEVHTLAGATTTEPLMKLLTGVEGHVAKFQDSLPPQHREMADVRRPEEKLRELYGADIAAWAAKFNPKQRTSAKSLRELDRINTKIDDQGPVPPVPEYMEIMRDFRRSLLEELQRKSPLDWAMQFDVSHWAARIVEEHGAAPADAQLRLANALTNLVIEFAVNRQKKSVALMLAPIVACTCAALRIDPIEPDELLILAVALGIEEAKAHPPIHAKNAGEREKVKAIQAARARDLEWFNGEAGSEGRCGRWRKRMPSAKEIDCWLGPELGAGTSGAQAVDVIQHQNSAIQTGTRHSHHWQLFLRLSPEAQDDFIHQVVELPASPQDEDFSDFLNRIVQLLPISDVGHDDSVKVTKTASSRMAKQSNDIDSGE